MNTNRSPAGTPAGTRPAAPKPRAKRSANSNPKPKPAKSLADAPVRKPRPLSAKPSQAELKAWYEYHMDQWHRHLAFFDENFEKYYRNPKYRDRYIAIKDRKVVATDNHELRLICRMERKYKGEYFFVARVAPSEPIEISIWDVESRPYGS